MPEQQVLPQDIDRILGYIARMAKGYGNKLKWNEIAKLKSDMMKNMDRWQLVTPSQVRDRCLEFDMTGKDTAEIVEMLEKRLERRVLIPKQGYRDFEFNHELSENEL